MNYRRKTAIILIIISLIMFSPIAHNVLIGFKNPFFQNLGFTHGTLAPWYVWILALLIAIGYVFYTFKAIPLVNKMQREISMFKLTGLFAGLAAGIIEELVFRRWLMDSAMNHGTGIIPQIIISGVAFGFAHTAWGMFGRNRKFGLVAFSATTVLGFSLAIVYAVGQRNIGPCIVAHCLISMIIEPWLMLAAISGQWKPAQTNE
jgi:uncharacterized protein